MALLNLPTNQRRRSPRRHTSGEVRGVGAAPRGHVAGIAKKRRNSGTPITAKRGRGGKGKPRAVARSDDEEDGAFVTTDGDAYYDLNSETDSGNEVCRPPGGARPAAQREDQGPLRPTTATCRAAVSNQLAPPPAFS
eukprot:Polyplicarium_translucidae@DN2596_c0_g1_i3.p2